MTYRSELIQVAAVAAAAAQDAACGTTALDKRTKEGARGWRELKDTLVAVSDERHSQEDKWGAQTHSRRDWLVILLEEVGEVAEEILAANPGMYGDDPFVQSAIEAGRQARAECESWGSSESPARCAARPLS